MTTQSIGARAGKAIVAAAILLALLATVGPVAGFGVSEAAASRDGVGPAKPDFVTGSDIADMVLDQFDPAQGTLLGADLTVEASISSSFSNVANDSSATADLTPQVRLDFCADFAAADAALPSDCAGSPTGMAGSLSAAETFTAVGPNGTDIRASVQPVVESASTVVALSGAQLEPFVGTGQVAMRFAADASIDMTGPGDGQMAWHTLASGGVAIDYVYAGIDIEKSTNGHDADIDPVPLTVGDTVEWNYAVTNTGSVDLVAIEVTDDMIGPICVIDRLAPGATRTCTWAGTALAGDYVNVGTATGTPDHDLASVDQAPVSAADPSRYVAVTPTPVPTAVPTTAPVPTPTPDPDAFGIPAIDIELATNGHDADQATGPEIGTGETITWSFVVTNTGTVDLFDLVVTDDRSAAVCTRPHLAYGHSFTCTRAGLGEPGQHRLESTVVAESAAGSNVRDVDPTHWHGPDEVLGTVPVPAAPEQSDEVLAHTGDARTIVTVIALVASALGLIALSTSETLRRRG